MSTKIAIKNENITTFGGIFHVLDEIKASGVASTIDSELGKRGSDGAYKYSEIFSALCATYMCGGDCLEDIEHIHSGLETGPGIRVPSPDTNGRVLKSLSTENLHYKSAGGHVYDVNDNGRLNDLLVHLLFTTGQLQRGQHIDLDFDHQFTGGDKYDAKWSYKGGYGYFPGIATVGNLVVGVENRDGNAPVKFLQDATLGRIFSRLTYGCGLIIDRFRADCGSFTHDVVRCADTFCKFFYLRASKCADRIDEFDRISDWKDVEINNVPCQVASVEAKGWHDNDGNRLRLVVQRTVLDDDGNPSLFGTEYVHRAILTNDWGSSDIDIVLFYNARGASERNFDALNNDFGWSRLPFSFMNHNAVFMLFMAMVSNFYHFVLNKLAKVVPGLSEASRLKRFIFGFLAVPAKWIKSGRRHILNLYTDRTFYPEAFAT